MKWHVAAIFFLLAIFMLILDPQTFVLVVAALSTGWIHTIGRLAMRSRISSGEVMLFVLSAGALVIGAHYFFCWVWASLKRPEETATIRKWRWKWTLCGFAIQAFVLFAIGSLVLATHQLYWISKSSESLAADPNLEAYQTENAAENLRKVAMTYNWNVSATRAFFFQRLFLSRGLPAAEIVRPIWIQRDKQTLRAIILVPRHPLLEDTASVAFIQPGGPYEIHKCSELPQILANFGIP